LLGVSGKVHARHKAPQKTTHEHRDHKVRSLRRSRWTRNRAGLDGPEAEAPFVIGGDATVALESAVRGLVLPVFRMVILAEGVRLPDFNYCVRDRNSVAVEDPSF